jgi:hypothetical protein
MLQGGLKSLCLRGKYEFILINERHPINLVPISVKSELVEILLR